jgi:hypothetical protein
VNINIDDISSFEAQILTREQNNQTWTTTQNMVETTTKNDTTSTTTTTNSITTPAPSKLSSWSGLSFTSSKWFTIVFPSKAISFASYPAKTNLGLSNTNCSSEIKVTSSKTQDLLESSPAVWVFVCATKESEWNLWNWLRLIKTSNWSNLIIKTYDNGRSSFAGNILAD